MTTALRAPIGTDVVVRQRPRTVGASFVGATISTGNLGPKHDPSPRLIHVTSDQLLCGQCQSNVLKAEVVAR